MTGRNLPAAAIPLDTLRQIRDRAFDLMNITRDPLCGCAAATLYDEASESVILIEYPNFRLCNRRRPMHSLDAVRWCDLVDALYRMERVARVHDEFTRLGVANVPEQMLAKLHVALAVAAGRRKEGV